MNEADLFAAYGIGRGLNCICGGRIALPTQPSTLIDREAIRAHQETREHRIWAERIETLDSRIHQIHETYPQVVHTIQVRHPQNRDLGEGGIKRFQMRIPPKVS